jgi:hypothetical protein
MSPNDQTITVEINTNDPVVKVENIESLVTIPYYLSEIPIIPVSIESVPVELPLTIMDYIGSSVGPATRYGSISSSITANIGVAGIRNANVRPYGEGIYSDDVYGSIVYGNTQYGVIDLPLSDNIITVGYRTTHGILSRSIVLGTTVSGNSNLKTSIAEISLASHNTPSTRTNHAILIRARTVSGSGGLIKAALYEGATNRSGDLTSTSLSNTLTDFTLPISDASAATITSYANLSIRIWGYDPNAVGLVFEVSNVKLQLPAA